MPHASSLHSGTLPAAASLLRVRMRTLGFVTTVAVAGWLINGCSGGTPIPAASSTSAGAAFSFAPTIQYSGTVTLPSGSGLTPDKLQVIDSVGMATPQSSGKFTIPAYNDGSIVAIAQSPAGNPMMMGWLDGTHTTISADTTAAVLAYYALGGMLTLNESDRMELITEIPQSPAFPALAQVVAGEISANPDAMAAPNANLTNAVTSFFTAVTAVTPASRQVKARPMDVTATPGPTSPQSGLTVTGQPPASAIIQNAYRRRSHAFVMSTADVVTFNPPVTTPDTSVVVPDFEISPTVGVNGGVTGTIASIFDAYFGNSPTAYAPVSSDPFNLPITNGFLGTNYQVLVVGPGLASSSGVSGLTFTQATAFRQVCVNGFVADALVPYLSNALFGSGFLADSSGHVESATLSAFKAMFINDLENDVFAFLASIPGEYAKVEAGQYKAVALDLLVTTTNAGSFRDVILQALQNSASKLGASAATNATLAQYVKSFNTILNAAGGVLQVLDSGIYAGQIAGSDQVDTWIVTSSTTTVSLTPKSTTFQGVGTQLLTANVLGVDDTTGYSYRWSVAPAAADNPLVGYLTEDGGANRSDQTSYCSSSPKAVYSNTVASVVALTAPATDNVTVAAFNGGNCTPGNQAGVNVVQIGVQTATVTTNPLTNVTLTPAATTIAPGGNVALTAAVPGANTTSYSYLWTDTGMVGYAFGGWRHGTNRSDFLLFDQSPGELYGQ